MTVRYRKSQSILVQPIAVVTVAVVLVGVAALIWWAESPGAVWAAVFIAALTLSLLLIRLTVTVDDAGVTVRLLGMSRVIPAEQITAVEAREYQPLRQFWGWGWRFGAQGSRAYTMAGNRAAVVTLVDGREVYLGAADVEELARAIEGLAGARRR